MHTKKINWSAVALAVDVFHVVFALGAITLGIVGFLNEVIRESLIYKINSLLWGYVVVLQILCLNCPLTQLSSLLRKLDNPDSDECNWGFIYWVCRKWLKLSVSTTAVTIVSLCVALVVLVVILV
jgi:hypothetical protein